MAAARSKACVVCGEAAPAKRKSRRYAHPGACRRRRPGIVTPPRLRNRQR